MSTIAEPPAAPAATSTGQTVSATGQTVSAWYDGAPAEVASFIQTKGWDNPLKAVDSYRNLEKILGADKIALPGKDAKPEDWNNVWNKLGRPESPDKYALPKVEGVELDKSKVEAVTKLMHETGITQAQAEKLFGWYAGDMKTALETNAQSIEQRRTQATEALKAEWKDRFDANLDTAKKAFLTFADDDLKAYAEESGMGDDPKFIKLFAKIGREMMEDSASGRGAGTFAGNSAAQAQAEIDNLKRDADFMKSMFDSRAVGHKEAKAKWNQLHQLAYPAKKPAAE